MYPSQPTGMNPQGQGNTSREEQPASSQGLGGVEWYAFGMESFVGLGRMIFILYVFDAGIGFTRTSRRCWETLIFREQLQLLLLSCSIVGKIRFLYVFCSSDGMSVYILIHLTS